MTDRDSRTLIPSVERLLRHAAGIALSGFGMEEDARLSREAGFAQHLVKPIDWRKLRAAIAEAFAKGQRDA